MHRNPKLVSTNLREFLATPHVCQFDSKMNRSSYQSDVTLYLPSLDLCLEPIIELRLSTRDASCGRYLGTSRPRSRAANLGLGETLMTRASNLVASPKLPHLPSPASSHSPPLTKTEALPQPLFYLVPCS